ncbi:hypothetical protein [Nioella sp. MMSF_3534]|uniref:hypothetical protein n=1 Tax=Nioella sp. MMSF_3534 TaxID=3046720 RepID=UPI00273FB388|nr:hypothetical protein [Nioella sp. MMSF_3534]
MKSAPEILPRISQDKTKAGPHLGCCIQLRQKYNFLIALGVFGKKANLHTVCRRMYETTTFRETKNDKRSGVSKAVQTINDATAYGRLDNTCREGPNCKSLIREELDFLRQCFARLFGDNAMGHVSDEFLLNGTMFQLLKSLNGAQIDLDWVDIDPILALEAVALAADPCLTIEIENFTGTRWSKQNGGIQPKPPVYATDVFTTEMEYRLFLDETIAREKPIVFEFFGAGEGRTEDGRPARAQILRHVVRSDDREGPWRVSEERNH